MSPRLSAIAGLVALAAPALGQESAEAPAEAPIEVAFVRHQNQIMIPVHVNGHGPHGFTLDTGSGMGVCIDSALAAELELRRSREALSADSDRLRTELAYATEPVVIGRVRSVNGVGGRVWRARLRGDVTVAGHTLETPAVSFYENDDDAMLGGALLNRFALTFDQKHRRVAFAPPDGDPRSERR